MVRDETAAVERKRIAMIGERRDRATLVENVEIFQRSNLPNL